MPLIFATPMGMSVEICFLMWPIRWVIAYFLVNLIVHPLGLKLAGKVFGFKLGMKTGLWNPLAFFISLIMSFIMPLIFGVPIGQLPVDMLIYLWPVRWVVAYFIVSQAVNPLAFKLAGKVFGFNPMNN
ncbi:MAG: hypothetical protein UIB31_03095 [Methanobrevibacter sp.]|nr:hypothetical protein [Methanobrevibacter sp.]